MARRSSMITLFLALLAIVLVAALISHPEPSFQAAVRGLGIWWDVVFPALLPFIVVSEILMGTGVVHFVGVLLEPLMRPLFNVPGTGGFVLTMGFSSGYPVAAKLTTRLREQGAITRAEGERLVSFATTGDPLFVIGAVAVGFFHSEQLGFVLAITHYTSAALLGVLYRFHAFGQASTPPLEKKRLPLIVRALKAMHRARLRDGRPFGQLMGEAVHSALQTLFMVGGFLIVFSVVIQLLTTTHVTRFLNAALTVLLAPLGVHQAFSQALVSGLFEVTLGAQAASAVPGDAGMIWKAAIASAILSWGGLSVHAQVASILSHTDIRFLPYLAARAMHAVLAAILTIALWHPLGRLAYGRVSSVPVYLVTDGGGTWESWRDTIAHCGLAALILFILLLGASALFRRLYPANRS